jgi:integrase
MAEREAQLRSGDRKEKGYYESRMYEYKKFLMSHHYTPSSVKQRLGKVAGLFSANGMRLNLPKTFWSKANESSELGEASVTTKRPPDNPEIRMILELADNAESLAVCLAYQDGLTPIDLTSLRWEALGYDPDDKATEFSFYKIRRSKTGEEAFCVINPDIKHFLGAVWKESSRPSEGWIFRGYRGERLQTQSITKAFNALAAKALGEKRANQITIKDLRDSFNMALLDAKIKQDAKDHYMGHKLDSARGAYAYSDAGLVEIYRERVFPKLTVNGWKYEKAKDQITEMAQKMEDLSNALKHLESENRAYKTRTDSLQEEIETIRRDTNETFYRLYQDLEQEVPEFVQKTRETYRQRLREIGTVKDKPEKQ